MFKADSLSSLQMDCGTLVILNSEHVTDEDEQGGWIGGTVTGGLKLLKWSIFLKENHAIFIAFITKFFSFRSTGYWQSPPKKCCSFVYKQPVYKQPALGMYSRVPNNRPPPPHPIVNFSIFSTQDIFIPTPSIINFQSFLLTFLCVNGHFHHSPS